MKKIDDRITEITNKRGGKVAQVITDVLSADGNRIDNTYKNYNEKGELTTTTRPCTSGCGSDHQRSWYPMRLPADERKTDPMSSAVRSLASALL